jgi:2-methylaconitate cis-trans-isomerase PrpF
MLPALAAGQRVRVNVLNNGDNVVCEVEAAEAGLVTFTVHFLCAPKTPVSSLLMTGEPVTAVTVDGAALPVSLVSMGNPYAFVSAADLGITSREQLFSDDPVLYARMTRIRHAVCALLGWDPAGAFPKIAVLLSGGESGVAARAISVPSWHPTLAVTGAICLGAAIRIAGTIPATLAGAAGSGDAMVSIETPGGGVQVLARTTGEGPDPHLGWVSIGGKKVIYQGTCPLPASLTDVQEDSACLPIPV